MICAFTEAGLYSGAGVSEPLYCLFQLKSATEDAQVEQDSAICLLPGNDGMILESFGCELPSLLLVNNDLSSLSSSPLLLGLATTHAV
ncbi:hypothetical protein Q3G72_031510 [Acer saccharum]|nr:hypothetical protein Q3G72_031510 [Acer saccharum]